MPNNALMAPNMPWLFGDGPVSQQNTLGPPAMNYAAPPNAAGQTLGSALADTAANVAQALPSWPSVEQQRQMLQPLPGWQGTAVDAARQYANAIMLGTTAPGDAPAPAWYHGTSTRFDGFNTPEVYITDNPAQAAQYAKGVHRPGQPGGGEPAVLPISPKPGQVQNIDDHLFDAMDEGTDLGDALDQAVTDARKGGQARYLEYTHPNAGDQGDHTVRISLYPQADLQLGK